MKVGILQFAKSPHFDSVKTRMTPSLSKEAATQLHCNLVQHVSKSIISFSSSDSEHRVSAELWGTTDCEFLVGVARKNGMSLHLQADGNLGERLKHAAKDGLIRNDALIVVGSDCPFIDHNYLDILVQKIRSHDVVVGPASDGGYVAIAFKVFYPSIFEGIEWGSDKVFGQTLSELEALKVNFTLMTSLSDIDRPDDLSLLETGKFSHLLNGVPFLH